MDKHNAPLACASLVVGLLFTSLASAQEFQRIAPKPVPPVNEAKPVEGTLNRGAAAEAMEPVAKPVSDDAAELVAKLKGLTFVASPEQVQKAGVISTGITLTSVTVPNPEGFKKLAGGYLGKKLTKGDLSKLVKDIVLFYRANDRPVVDVIVPEQEVTAGTVQIVLLEGKLGEISVTGNRWFSSETIKNSFRAESGDVLSARRLQKDLDWVNSNPFHSSDIVMRPGKKLGQTDIELKTVDRFPLRPYIGYENSGNETTELDRYIAGFNWGDAFGLGLDQQLNYQFATSGDGTSLRAHSGSYLIPLPWRHTLSFFGSYVDTEGRVPPVVDLNGRSYQISGRYTIPLPTYRSPRLSLFHTVGLGFDFKYNENALEFNALQVGQTLYDIDQFVLTYNATQNDELGRTTLNNTFNYSPGNLSSNNEDADFASARALAESQYVYNNLVLERLTRLPADFSLIVRLTLQNSDGNLVPSEQLGFGGYNTIRGYEEREVNTDEGYIITTELRSPTFSLSEITGLKLGVSDQFQILAFWDYGSASNHTPLDGEVDSIELSSIGAGLRFSLGTYASVRFDYGFQLTRSSIDLQYGSRANIGVVVSY